MKSDLLIYIFLITSRTTESAPCIIASDDAEMGLTVKCSNKRLTSFWQVWPTPVKWLDLSINNLSHVSGLTNPCFSELRHLDLSRNMFHVVPSETLENLKELEWLDLSYNNLGLIPSDAFRGLHHLEFLALSQTGLVSMTAGVFGNLSRLLTLNLNRNSLAEIPTSALERLSHLQSLNLGHNAISVVKNMTFVHMAQLLYLDLQSNALIALERDAFVGLEHLVELDLSLNQLILNNVAYPAGVFNSLISLQNLKMHENDNNNRGIYPENVFAPLTSLRCLSIDTFHDSHFGTAFSTLTSLTSLDLSSNCKIANLTNSSFVAFQNSSLQRIHFNHCIMNSIDICALCFLPNLQILQFSEGKGLDVNKALSVMYGLQFQTVPIIDLSANNAQPSVLDIQSFFFISTICADEISFRQCRIVAISFSVVHLLYKSRLGACIKRLDLSRNMLASQSDGLPLLRILFKLSNLESLSVEDQAVHYLTDSCQYTENKCGVVQDEDDDIQNRITIYIRFPPKLKYFNISGIRKIGPLPGQISFVHADRLLDFSLSYCGITRCKSTFTGMTALETLDLSGNICKMVNASMLQNMPSLKTLKLSSLNLDQDLLQSSGHDLLGHLQRLEHLDLSNNGLERLPVNLLDGHAHIAELFLGKNRFVNVPLDVSLNPSLRILDLSNNIITTLSTHERSAFDALALNHTFTLRLRKNLLSCTCENMDFVLWLRTTEVKLDGNINDKYDNDYDDNGRSYPCVSEDGTLTSTGAIHENFVHQWRRCVGERTFWLALSALCLQILALFIALLLSRSWTHVRYVINVLRKMKFPRRLDFRKDAYIVYCNEDENLVIEMSECLGTRKVVRLLLRYKEELPGSVKAENIVESIDDSWKIVILVTSNLTQDQWAAFTVLQAQHSITDTMPDRVIIVFAEDPAHLPHMTSLQHLLRMVPEKNVFSIPRGTPPAHSQWDRLAETILYEEN